MVLEHRESETRNVSNSDADIQVAFEEQQSQSTTLRSMVADADARYPEVETALDMGGVQTTCDQQSPVGASESAHPEVLADMPTLQKNALHSEHPGGACASWPISQAQMGLMMRAFSRSQAETFAGVPVIPSCKGFQNTPLQRQLPNTQQGCQNTQQTSVAPVCVPMPPISGMMAWLMPMQMPIPQKIVATETAAPQASASNGPSKQRSGASPRETLSLADSIHPTSNRVEPIRLATSVPPSAEVFTTVMLRNLPNQYTRDMLKDLLESEGFAEKFTFLYVPTDFKTHVGLGYAFVDLISQTEAQRVRQHFEDFSNWAVKSDKVCTVSWSHPDQQGCAAHVARYRNSPVMHESIPDAWKPALFSGGVRARFPAPTRRLRMPRVRVL